MAKPPTFPSSPFQVFIIAVILNIITSLAGGPQDFGSSAEGPEGDGDWRAVERGDGVWKYRA
ncbi:hypothetical protein PQX77_011172, partial [Marasmius sp. AFHP31]